MYKKINNNIYDIKTNIGKITFLSLMFFIGSMQFIFAAEGDLDVTFNPAGTPPGTVETLIGTTAQANGVAIQADGKIVAAGQATVGGVVQFAVARYNKDGSLDTSFGVGGIVVTVIGTSATIRSIAIQSDGKIVAAGRATFGGIVQFAVARYNTNGSLDSSFGVGGIVLTDTEGGSSQAYSVAIQSDGKIVAAGTSSDLIFGTQKIAVVRYNTDGSLDTTFGSNGIVLTNIGDDNPDVANAIAIQSDGKIVVAGNTATAGTPLVVIRYNTDGSLDATFGLGGIVLTEVGTNAVALAVAIQSDGKIVVGGFVRVSNSILAFLLARYNTDGSLDSSFGSGGIVTTTVTGFNENQINSIALQFDGKIVAGGFIRPSIGSGAQKFAVARYNTDGSLDVTFGYLGIVQTSINGVDDQINSVALQLDGKIVAAGFTRVGAIFEFALARYLANTTLIQSALTIAIKNKYCGNGA